MTEELVKKCGKMMILDKMLPELRKRGHKVGFQKVAAHNMWILINILELTFFSKISLIFLLSV